MKKADRLSSHVAALRKNELQWIANASLHDYLVYMPNRNTGRVRVTVRVNFSVIFSRFSATLQLCFADLFLRGQLYNSVLLRLQPDWYNKPEAVEAHAHCILSNMEVRAVDCRGGSRN